MSAFEDEVRQVAAAEGTITPEVAVDPDVRGRAASTPSGRLIRVHPDVLSWPEPAQRWLAGHEMRHVMAHGWSELGRWVGLGGALVGLGMVGAVAWWSPLPSAWMPLALISGLAAVVLLWLVGTSWWSRRLEAEADRFAARGGRLEALDESSLLELLIGSGDTPLWLSSHPRWRDRLPVPGDRIPASISSIETELEQAIARLSSAGFRCRPPILVMVRRLPGDRVAVERWQRVVVAKIALSTPGKVLQPLLTAAVIQARRLPLVRAAAAVSTAFLGLLATVAASVTPRPEPAVHTAALLGAMLLLIAVYEVYRRAADRRLLRSAAALGQA